MERIFSPSLHFPPIGKHNHLFSMRAKSFLSKDGEKAGIYSNQNLLNGTMTFNSTNIRHYFVLQ